MSFDAGQFFSNLFNSIGNISEKSINKTGNTNGYNFHGEETKYLPDEAPDEENINTKNMVMYGVPNEYEEGPIAKYGIPSENIKKYAVPEPTYEESPVAKYALPEPTYEESPVAKYAVPKPTKEEVLKYAVPDPTIENPPQPMYAVPDETIENPPQPMYAVPDPTTENSSQPVNQSNPWRLNFAQSIRNIFTGGISSFTQRLNNFFTSLFSGWR